MTLKPLQTVNIKILKVLLNIFIKLSNNLLQIIVI